MPHHQDLPDASLHAALRAIAAARPDASLAVLILTLLLRLLARMPAAWFLSPDDESEEAYGDEYDFAPWVAPGPSLCVLLARPMGRAPHAACIEAGLAPDWILPGMRNRGMRATPIAHPPSHHSLRARAPPTPCPSRR